jgi:hypothetical protein
MIKNKYPNYNNKNFQFKQLIVIHLMFLNDGLKNDPVIIVVGN